MLGLLDVFEVYDGSRPCTGAVTSIQEEVPEKASLYVCFPSCLPLTLVHGGSEAVPRYYPRTVTF